MRVWVRSWWTQPPGLICESQHGNARHDPVGSMGLLLGWTVSGLLCKLDTHNIRCRARLAVVTRLRVFQVCVAEGLHLTGRMQLAVASMCLAIQRWQGRLQLLCFDQLSSQTSSRRDTQADHARMAHGRQQWQSADQPAALPWSRSQLLLLHTNVHHYQGPDASGFNQQCTSRLPDALHNIN